MKRLKANSFYLLITLFIVGSVLTVINSTRTLGVMLVYFFVPIILIHLYLRTIKTIKEVRHDKVLLKPPLLIINIIIIVTYPLGILFKLMHWSGASELIIFTLGLTPVIAILGIVYFIKNKKVFNRTFALEFVLILLPLLFLTWQFGMKAIFRDIPKEQYSTNFHNELYDLERHNQYLDSLLQIQFNGASTPFIKAIDEKIKEVTEVKDLLILVAGGTEPTNENNYGKRILGAYEITIAETTLIGLNKKGKAYDLLSAPFDSLLHKRDYYEKRILQGKYLIEQVVIMTHIKHDLLLRKQEYLLSRRMESAPEANDSIP